MKKSVSLLGALVAVAGSQVLAQAQENVEEITVIGRQEFLETQFTAQRSASNVDAAGLMNEVPGGAGLNNGPLTGQIQYRGMFGPRVNVRVDGMLIHGGGPNWMAPPLQHIPAGLMEELVIEQGIPSIATGGGIGGAATALWKRPQYGSDNNWEFTGDTEAAFSTVDSGNSYSAVIGAVNENNRFYVVGSDDEGDDYDTPEGEVAATQYERQVYGIGYGFRSGVNEFEINFHRMEVDDTGTPSLPMDIDWFDTDIWNVSYSTELSGVGLEFRVYGSDIDHGMSNSLLRPTPDFSSLPLPPFVGDDKRTVFTESEEIGYKFTLSTDLAGGNFIAGLEGKQAEHDASVFDPDFAPFFVNNFNNSETDSQSVFAQWSSLQGQRWYFELGTRLERFESETGEVDAFPARLVDMNPGMWPMGTPPRAVWMLRESFNNADRTQLDDNVDVVAKTRYQATENLVIEVGIAQKVRSPMYQERYLWIPLEANAGLGDGNNYVGNPELSPEEAMQFELGFDLDMGNWYFSPRLFRRDVDDYIQGVPATNMAVIGVSANANGDPTPLMFANTEAEFTGIDMTFGMELSSSLRIEGIASSVRGRQTDLDDNLYRVAPESLRLNLIYETNNAVARIEQVFVDNQNDLSRINTFDPSNPNNSFVPTEDYYLTNAYATWNITDSTTLSFGVENLLDEEYISHLTGFNRVLDSVVPRGTRMYGRGRNVFGRIQFIW